jgi:hypothetical protein
MRHQICIFDYASERSQPILCPMKTIIIILAILSFNIRVNAQNYAIIKDSDGYTNVRRESNSKSPVVGKIYNDGLFSYNDDNNIPAGKSEWIKIYQTRENGGFLEGYVHKSRVLPLSSLKSVLATKPGANSAIVNNDSIVVKVTAANFIAKNHKLDHIKSSPYYEKIDGKKIWGTDGGLPKKAITGLSIVINGSDLSIPKSAVTNLYEPNFDTLRAYLGPKNTIYVQMNNSDGAGGYTVIWTFKNGKYQSRYLDNSEA